LPGNDYSIGAQDHTVIPITDNDAADLGLSISTLSNATENFGNGEFELTVSESPVNVLRVMYRVSGWPRQ